MVTNTIFIALNISESEYFRYKSLKTYVIQDGMVTIQIMIDIHIFSLTYYWKCSVDMILTDSLSQVFCCIKLHKKNLEIYIFFT